MTDTEVAPLLGPFKTAFENKAMEQLEGMIGTLRVFTSRLATKESYWIFHKDGDDFDLKVSDPKHPSYLLIANDPEMESIIGALNALILNRLVTRVNTGQGKNIPVSIIVDELPTLYFHKIDRLIGTARSNKVSVALGFQELRKFKEAAMAKETACAVEAVMAEVRPFVSDEQFAAFREEGLACTDGNLDAWSNKVKAACFSEVKKVVKKDEAGVLTFAMPKEPKMNKQSEDIWTRLRNQH